MPSPKKRIALTVDGDLFDTITALAELQDLPKTEIIMQILRDVQPALLQLKSALEDVRDKKDPQAALSALFVSMTEQYSDVATGYASLAQGVKK